MSNKTIKYKLFSLFLLLILLSIAFYELFSLLKSDALETLEFRGFGWYGYLADDRIDEQSLQKIKELGGNSVNINVYYEYDPYDEVFILKSNLTRAEENIDLAHQHNLTVFLSPFANLIGGHYLANKIEGDVEGYLDGARNISIQLAEFSQENDVEIYAIWNEMGLSLTKIHNSTDIVNEWLQNTRKDVAEVYDGILTTKEGVQLGNYRDYDFSGFDYIGITFYPFTTSYYTDSYSNMTFAGVESLEEYEKVVKEEYNHLSKLKERFKNDGVILGEIGVDVVAGNFIVNDNESKETRAKAYEIVLINGKDKIDGFFFSRFEHDDGGSNESDEIFNRYFS